MPKYFVELNGEKVLVAKRNRKDFGVGVVFTGATPVVPVGLARDEKSAQKVINRELTKHPDWTVENLVVKPTIKE